MLSMLARPLYPSTNRDVEVLIFLSQARILEWVTMPLPSDGDYALVAVTPDGDGT